MIIGVIPGMVLLYLGKFGFITVVYFLKEQVLFGASALLRERASAYQAYFFCLYHL